MGNLIKRFSGMFTLLLIVGVLVACGGVDEIESDEKAKAKTGEEATPASTETDEEETDENESDEQDDEEIADTEDPDDIWTYYEDATWEDDFAGLVTKIEKVTTTDKGPNIETDEEDADVIGVKFTVENTTEHKFDTYPDQATLVTSTGEQVDAEMLLSDHIGGTIDKGVIKEGDVFFYLERGEVDSIEWVKLEWMTTDLEAQENEDWDNEYMYHEVELPLD